MKDTYIVQELDGLFEKHIEICILSHSPNERYQVWSLTQFYSVDFKIKDRCKKVRFQHTHNQGLRQLLLTVSWDLRA